MNLRDVASAAVLLSRFGRDFYRTKSDLDPHRVAEFCLCVSFARRYWERRLSTLVVSEHPAGLIERAEELRELLEEVSIAEFLLRVTLASMSDLLSARDDYALARCSEFREFQTRISSVLETGRWNLPGLQKSRRLRDKLDVWCDLLLSGMRNGDQALYFAVDEARAREFRGESCATSNEDVQDMRDQLELAAFRLVVPSRVVSDETTARIFGEWIEFAMYFVSGTSFPVKTLSAGTPQRMMERIYAVNGLTSED